MNTITLVLVLMLSGGGEARLQYNEMFPDSVSCADHAIGAAMRFMENERVEKVDYYCIETGEKV